MTRDKVRNVSASVLARLLTLAKETGDDYQTLLLAYAAERFLFRLGAGPVDFYDWLEDPSTRPEQSAGVASSVEARGRHRGACVLIARSSGTWYFKRLRRPALSFAMRGFIANTDYDWFTFLRSIEPPIGEVNFWRPGATRFAALQSGEPVLFRLKAPRNVIGGFGFFSHYSYLPLSVVWDTYGIANGAPDFAEVHDRLLRYRSRFGMSATPKEDFWLGCILLTDATFFVESDWIREPDDFARNSPPGQSYDLTQGEGQRIWLECVALANSNRRPTTSVADRPIQGGYGEPLLVRPRYGQKSFRIAILDAYGRRCAVTSERTLPALEAAHIRDYHDVQTHTLSNGILFRADIHKLFGSGYVTVTPDMRFEVSRRIKEEFENGRDYYAMHGITIRPPEKTDHRPDVQALSWHNEERYLG